MTEKLKIYIAKMLISLEELQWNFLMSDMNFITLNSYLTGGCGKMGVGVFLQATTDKRKWPWAVPGKAQAGHQGESFHW